MVANDKTIKHTVIALPGSKLEKSIFQALLDMEANFQRLKMEYQKRLQKQQTKIERRL